MSRTFMSHKLGIWIIGMILGLSPLTFAAAATPLELMQIHASRAVGSLVMYRGEGMQKTHANRLESDLAALASAYQGSQQANDELKTTYQELVKQIRLGTTFGPNEDDLPWRYAEELSKSLRDFLFVANGLAGSTAESAVPVEIEYLAMQYLYRSYMGSFETARDQTDMYIGQDERRLVPTIDAVLAKMDDKDPAIAKLKVRWAYLRSALNDMNSQSNTLESVSGRSFAPITVSRHSRALTENWLLLESNAVVGS